MTLDGMTPVDELKARLSLPDLPAEGSYHTLAGLLLALLRRVPRVGDRIVFGGWRFEVLEMDGRRVDKVLAGREPAAEILRPPTVHDPPMRRPGRRPRHAAGRAHRHHAEADPALRRPAVPVLAAARVRPLRRHRLPAADRPSFGEIERAAAAIAGAAAPPGQDHAVRGTAAGRHRRRGVPCARPAAGPLPAVQRRLRCSTAISRRCWRTPPTDGPEVIGSDGAAPAGRCLPLRRRRAERRPRHRIPGAAAARTPAARSTAGIYLFNRRLIDASAAGLLAGGRHPARLARAGACAARWATATSAISACRRISPARRPKSRRCCSARRCSWTATACSTSIMAMSARATASSGSTARWTRSATRPQAGWHVFIVTNQSGVARGYYDEAAVHDLLDWIGDQARRAGGTIDDVALLPLSTRTARWKPTGKRIHGESRCPACCWT